MASSSTFLTIALLLALPLRIVLDLASANSPRPGFDIAYALLFIIVGVAVLVDDATSYWGYAMLGLSTWSLFSFALKRKRAQNAYEKQNT
jgi:hypothetical protein